MTRENESKRDDGEGEAGSGDAAQQQASGNCDSSVR